MPLLFVQTSGIVYLTSNPFHIDHAHTHLKNGANYPCNHLNEIINYQTKHYSYHKKS